MRKGELMRNAPVIGHIVLVIVAIVFCVIVVGCLSSTSEAPPPAQVEIMEAVVQPGLKDGLYRVTRVIDGDTIILENAGRLRFRNFDAEEPDSKKGSFQKYLLIKMVEGELVYVDFARVKGPGRNHGRLIKDKYGRLLADVYIREKSAMTASDPSK